MADANSETHSGDIPILQPLPPIHFVNGKACSSQNQQEQPDLQTGLNNSFQLFADTLMSTHEKLTNKIVEKSPSRAKAKGKRLRKGRQSNDGRASSEPSSDSEDEQRKRKAEKQKIKNLRLIPLELRLPRGKNPTKGEVVINQSMNMMTESVVIPIMTVKWPVT